MEREEKFDQFVENMKVKQLPDILLYQIICLVLQCQVVQLDDQIKSDDPQLSQKFEEVIDDYQEPSLEVKLTLDRVNDTSKLSSLDHEAQDIPCESKI